eukprot:TRINITY_DN8907_c0_g2_i1.p1 TRINITY_DN8907_c0_g2~~TRINITY_DN8907_c0_g2_i1.p1  ORF type:complete len:517 (-),score=129.53 TRINITY_DN8907_c0_g2_i1:147-1697(-)
MNLLFILCVCFLFVSVDSQYQTNIWPLPQSSSTGTNELFLSSTAFAFQCTGASCSPNLQAAFARYTSYVFFGGPSAPAPGPFIKTVNVAAASNPDLTMGVDESYTLQVPSTGQPATITAQTEWGALRGIETFSQLVDMDLEGIYSINCTPVAVSDFPRYPHRGLLIDSSRHFLPLSTIFRAIDALSFNKMNVLHWHIVDDQSFPIESATYPLLSKDGAWAPTAVYSRDDVSAVIAYAWARGIRVIPEFDMPGHTISWGKGYPSLFPNCPGARLVMNPADPATFTFVGNFLKEMSGVFPEPFVHLGGDEVDYTCWMADANVTAWMKANNLTNYAQVQGFFEQKVQALAYNNGKTPFFWEEVFFKNTTVLANETIVVVWTKDNTFVAEVARAGYRTLWQTPWYLDRQVPEPQQNYFWEDTWKDFYVQDPVGTNTLEPWEAARILGGEASMWGEQVDYTAFDVRVWPRAGAIAERLWSAQNITDPDVAVFRLGAQRCRMVRRGISAGPLFPDFCVLSQM